MGLNISEHYGYFQSDYRVNEIPKVNRIDGVQPVQEAADEEHQNSLALQFEEEELSAARKNVNPNELSIGINRGKDYSYIGRDSDLRNLDMQKAISDMKQDTVLQDYNYFVGSARNGNIYQSEDGVVRLK